MKKEKNEIFGCMYISPTMDVKTFNDKHLSETIAKITDEKKVCNLAGDFNRALLKSETIIDTKDFFDILTSEVLVPHTTSLQNN